jgi:8-oxo-dGTP diphosphatase
LFYRELPNKELEVWTQIRTDDGPYHGLLEFPGGGIEAGETPLEAAVREVEEEVGIRIAMELGKLFATYSNELPGKTILLYVHLFPAVSELEGKGHWLRIKKDQLSEEYQGKIPGPNHKIINDLYAYLQKL